MYGRTEAAQPGRRYLDGVRVSRLGTTRKENRPALGGKLRDEPLPDRGEGWLDLQQPAEGRWTAARGRDVGPEAGCARTAHIKLSLRGKVAAGGDPSADPGSIGVMMHSPEPKTDCSTRFARERLRNLLLAGAHPRRGQFVGLPFYGAPGHQLRDRAGRASPVACTGNPVRRAALAARYPKVWARSTVGPGQGSALPARRPTLIHPDAARNRAKAVWARCGPPHGPRKQGRLSSLRAPSIHTDKTGEGGGAGTDHARHAGAKTSEGNTQGQGRATHGRTRQTVR